MKNTILLISFTALLSCGNDTTNDEVSLETSGDNVEQNEQVNTSTFAPIKSLLIKNEFSAEELYQVASLFNDETVTLVGYPNGSSNETIVNFEPNKYGATMINNPDKFKSDNDVRLMIKDGAETVQLNQGEKFAVKGKIRIGYSVSESFGNKVTITLFEAEIVPFDESNYLETISLDNLELSKQLDYISLEKLIKEHNEILLNKESITVTDTYYSSTSSSTSYGNSYDVDLGVSGALVRCSFIDEPNSDRFLKDRNDKKSLSVIGKYNGMDGKPLLIEAKEK